MQNLPLLAIDIGSVFTAVFLIVMFLGWVMQAVQGQNQPNRRGGGGAGNRGDRGGRGAGERRPAEERPRPRRRDDRIRSEIDAFLDEVDQRPQREPEPVIEIVEPPRERPRPVRSQQQRPNRPQQRPERSRPQPAARPEPQRGSRDLSGVGAHVATYMDSHIDEDVAEHLPHLAPNVGTSASDTPRRGVHPLVAKLRNPAGVREAIILMEVLARPRLLRRETAAPSDGAIPPTPAES